MSLRERVRGVVRRAGLHYLARCTCQRARQSQDAPGHETDPVEVLPQDWIRAANALRDVLGLPHWQGPCRYPTVEELLDWERAMPGSASWWRNLARKEAEHRCWLARHGVRRRG